MDKFDLVSMLDMDNRSSKTRGKKRKWREIEAIQEKYRLRKELEDIDMLTEYELAELDF